MSYFVVFVEEVEWPVVDFGDEPVANAITVGRRGLGGQTILWGQHLRVYRADLRRHPNTQIQLCINFKSSIVEY